MTSEARLVIGWALVGGGYALLLFSCTFSMWKGSPAERLGGLFFLVSTLFDIVVGLASGKTNSVLTPMLLFDALVAVGFLALAIRYNNLWLGGVMMLKGVQLGLHATHLTDEADMRIAGFNAYILALDGVSISISLALIFATLSALRRRRAAREARLHGEALRSASPA